MSINSLLLNKQIELFVKDFFVEKLLTADKLDDDSYIGLRSYLNQRLTELKKNSGIDFSVNEYRDALFEFCSNLGVMKGISIDKEKAMSAVVEIINEQSKMSEDIIDRISFHIRQAYKNGLDINKLYAPIYSENEIKPDTDLHNNINEFMAINKSCDMKESIGVLNTFIETTQWSKSKVQSIIDETRPNDDNFSTAAAFRQRHNVNFIKYIAKEINKTSLAGDAFTTHYNDIYYNRRTGSEYDHFMYNPENKTFSICLATKSKNTKIEKNNIFTQPLSLIYLCNNLIEKINGEVKPVSKEATIEVLRSALNEEINFRTESLRNNYIPDENLSGRNVKSYNKRPNLIIKNLIAQGELSPSIIKAYRNIGQKSMIDTYSHKDAELIELLQNNMCSFKMNDKDVDNLFNVLNSHKEFKVDIFFFGEVSSKRNKSFDYSSVFSDEEIRAGANILAYAGRAMDGFDGIELTPTGAIKFLEKLKFRFNTSTNQKQNCVDLIKINEKLRDIGGVIINNFIQNENLDQVIKMYKNDNGATKGFESMDVLHNISLFEKNVIGQIIEGIQDNKMTPEQAYLNTLTSFNTSPKINLDQFMNLIEEKHILVNDEVVAGTLDKLQVLKQVITNYNLKQEVLKSAETVAAQLKSSNVPPEIIKETLYTMLKDKNIENIDSAIETIMTPEQKKKRKNQM
jgi:hypothetical protein